MPIQITLAIYNQRIFAKHGEAYSALAYKGLSTPVPHRCALHGKYVASPFPMLYTKQPSCPQCKSLRRSAASKAIRAAESAPIVKNYLHDIKKAGVLRLTSGRLSDLLGSRALDSFSWVCGCGTILHKSIRGAAKTKIGCRKCTNLAVNTCKKISPAVVVGRLRAEFPDTVILGLVKDPYRQVSGYRVRFKCVSCHGTTTQSRWSFGNSKHHCLPCNNKYVARKGAHSGFNKFEYTVGDKTFVLQGYEGHALDLLLEEMPARRIKDSRYIKPITYIFEGKSCQYFPDFMYGKTIVEVKSIHTAGLTTGKVNYAGFRRLKAKAKATIEAGFSFRLMLLLGNTKDDLYEVELPDDWMHIKARTLLNHLGISRKKSNS